MAIARQPLAAANDVRRSPRSASVLPDVSLPAGLRIRRRPEPALYLNSDTRDVAITQELGAFGELDGDGFEKRPAVDACQWPA
jgi:hypothetical protein